MSNFGHWYVVVLVVGNIAALVWLIRWSQKPSAAHTTAPGDDTTGHVWDVDLAEYNNPLPRWWVGLFYLGIIAAIVYLIFIQVWASFQAFWAGHLPSSIMKKCKKPMNIMGRFTKNTWPCPSPIWQKTLKQSRLAAGFFELLLKLPWFRCSRCQGFSEFDRRRVAMGWHTRAH